MTFSKSTPLLVQLNGALAVAGEAAAGLELNGQNPPSNMVNVTLLPLSMHVTLHGLPLNVNRHAEPAQLAV